MLQQRAGGVGNTVVGQCAAHGDTAAGHRTGQRRSDDATILRSRQGGIPGQRIGAVAHGGPGVMLHVAEAEGPTDRSALATTGDAAGQGVGRALLQRRNAQILGLERRLTSHVEACLDAATGDHDGARARHADVVAATSGNCRGQHLGVVAGVDGQVAGQVDARIGDTGLVDTTGVNHAQRATSARFTAGTGNAAGDTEHRFATVAAAVQIVGGGATLLTRGQVVIGFGLGVDIGSSARAVEVELAVLERRLRCCAEQAVESRQVRHAARIDIDRAALERRSFAIVGVDTRLDLVVEHHDEQRTAAGAALVAGGNSHGDGPSEHPRRTVGGKVEGGEVARGAAQPFGEQLVADHAKRQRAADTGAFAFAAGERTAANQQTRAIVSCDLDTARRTATLVDGAVDDCGTGGVGHHGTGAGQRHGDVGLASGGHRQAKAHGDLVTGADSLNLEQIVVVQRDVVKQRLGDVVQVVVGDRTGDGRAELALLAAGQGQGAAASTAELVGLVERQHGDLAALGRVARVENDVPQVRAVLLARYVDGAGAGDGQAQLAARFAITT